MGYLVELWSWGRLSPQTLRIIVDKAKQDILAYAAGTLDFTEIEQLSTIGAEGHATQNALRDLERKLSVPRLDKARFSFNCLMRSPMARFVLQDNMQDAILPHHFFHILHRDYPDEFQKKFVGDPGVLSDFWLDQAGNPLLDDHPLMSRANWQTTTIPLAIHGDATPVAGIGKGWGKQVDIYSFYSLVAHGTTRDLMVLLYAGFVHLLTKDSMLQVWRILVWSFKALAKGCWPETDAYGMPFTNAVDKDRAGTPLAGEYAAVVCCIEGGLDCYSKNLGLRHWSSGHRCCWCPANKTEGDGICWNEFRAGAAEWQEESWTSSEWREAHPEAHPLLSLPGVGIQNVFADWCHSKHLGCDKQNYGSVFYLLCYDLLPGDPATNLDVIWGEILQYCRDHNIGDRFRQMKLSLFTKPRTPLAAFPKMRGKAIEIRNLGQPLCHVWASKMDVTNMLHQQIAFMLRCSVKLENTLKDNRQLFRYPPELADEFVKTTSQYLQLTSAIARQYNEASRKLFDMTVKHHILWHCANSLRLLNPSKSWCYMGEDNMQHGRRLASSALPSTKPQNVGNKILLKWLRGYTLRL